MRVVWVNEKHDTDRDGIPNYYDCNPWNPHQQGWLHDKLQERKEKKAEQQQIEKEREGKEEYIGAVKQHRTQEKEIQKQFDRRNKPVYIYVKTGDPRFKGGLRWHFVGGYDRKYLSQIAQELGKRDDIYGVESSDRSDMESYLNKRDLKKGAAEYVKDRKWKENVAKGLMTKDKQDQLRRVREYKKMMELERQVTGAPQVIMHSGSEFQSIIRGPPRYRRIIR